MVSYVRKEKLNAAVTWCLLQDANGKIGLTPDGKMSFDAVQIMQGFTVRKIASGTDHLACLTADGDIYTLGRCHI